MKLIDISAALVLCYVCGFVVGYIVAATKPRRKQATQS